jgi:hypothetical protein
MARGTREKGAENGVTGTRIGGGGPGPGSTGDGPGRGAGTGAGGADLRPRKFKNKVDVPSFELDFDVGGRRGGSFLRVRRESCNLAALLQQFQSKVY